MEGAEEQAAQAENKASFGADVVLDTGAERLFQDRERDGFAMTVARSRSSSTKFGRWATSTASSKRNMSRSSEGAGAPATAAPLWHAKVHDPVA
jgi:hypothetical protein